MAKTRLYIIYKSVSESVVQKDLYI